MIFSDLPHTKAADLDAAAAVEPTRDNLNPSRVRKIQFVRRRRPGLRVSLPCAALQVGGGPSKSNVVVSTSSVQTVY